MKTLIGLTAFTLTLLSLAPAVLAEGAGNPKITHIVHSASHSISGLALHYGFHIGLHVVGNPLEKVTVGLPQGIAVSEDAFAITDGLGQPISATVSMTNGQAIIAFAQPVASETTVNIASKRINGSRNISSMLPVSATFTGMSAEIPLGMTSIKTTF